MQQPTTIAGWLWLLATAILLPATVAWTAARVQSAEIRRQLNIKFGVEHSTAATNLLRGVEPMHRRCEERFVAVHAWLSSEGSRGSVGIIGDISLPDFVDLAAAQLGPDVAGVAASLRSALGRAVEEENAAAAADIGPKRFAEMHLHSLANLIVLSRELSARASRTARLDFALHVKVAASDLRLVRESEFGR